MMATKLISSSNVSSSFACLHLQRCEEAHSLQLPFIAAYPILTSNPHDESLKWNQTIFPNFLFSSSYFTDYHHATWTSSSCNFFIISRESYTHISRHTRRSSSWTLFCDEKKLRLFSQNSVHRKVFNFCHRNHHYPWKGTSNDENSYPAWRIRRISKKWMAVTTVLMDALRVQTCLNSLH